MEPAFLLADAGTPLFLIPMLLGIAFWLWMLVDCANRETEGSTKLAWLLIILFVGVIGAPLYFSLRKLPRQKLSRYESPQGLIQPWRKS
jgi:uncharacterized membrane protein